MRGRTRAKERTTPPQRSGPPLLRGCGPVAAVSPHRGGDGHRQCAPRSPSFPGNRSGPPLTGCSWRAPDACSSPPLRGGGGHRQCAPRPPPARRPPPLSLLFTWAPVLGTQDFRWRPLVEAATHGGAPDDSGAPALLTAVFTRPPSWGRDLKGNTAGLPIAVEPRPPCRALHPVPAWDRDLVRQHRGHRPERGGLPPGRTGINGAPARSVEPRNVAQ